ncbi:MAG TPA: Glu/Leu/Phe/Val dehydrogenase dimerization domain-containing protein, partial [Alphaproteobacteria bacterium]|nr:Glu/Leu/Phe/Val dehydrogenase dimerization domain-containing protein [Alphaproteobacteria bacterium]
MSVFASPSFHDHEQVVFCRDAAAGLRAIIAIHDTTLGPALGGCRIWAYPDDDAALEDVLRLSRGMTYKAALARLPYGGGKAVIIADARHDKTPALMQAFGRAVDRLGGRYITAEDVGTSPDDMMEVHKSTGHVVGIAAGSKWDGDPSPATAWGCFHGLRATVRHALGRDDLAGLRVAIQGLGHVGWALAGFLHEVGAELTVTDIDSARLDTAKREFGATVVEPDRIYDATADVFAPCALGAVLN